MGFVFGILGWLCVASGLGYAVFLFQSAQGQVSSLALFLAIVPGLGVIITGCLFLAVSAALGLLSQIERNTAYSADMLERMAGGDERKQR